MRMRLAAVALATATVTGAATLAPAAAETPVAPTRAVTVAAPPMPVFNLGNTQVAVIPSLIATIVASIIATLIINDPEVGSTGAKKGDSFSSNEISDDDSGKD